MVKDMARRSAAFNARPADAGSMAALRVSPFATAFHAAALISQPMTFRLPFSVAACNRREPMSVQKRALYPSAPDDDRWFLVHETGSERVFVKHEPNGRLRGQTPHIEIGDFLAGGRRGREHQS